MLGTRAKIEEKKQTTIDVAKKNIKLFRTEKDCNLLSKYGCFTIVKGFTTSSTLSHPRGNNKVPKEKQKILFN